MLEEKSREISHTPRESQPKMKEDIGKLAQAKDKLRKQRGVLDSKLHDGALLTPQEERRSVQGHHSINILFM